MRTLVLAAIFVVSSSAAIAVAQSPTAAPVTAQPEDRGEKASDGQSAGSPSKEEAGEPSIILHSKSNKYGTYNIGEGARGAFWSAQGIWNASTKSYTGLTIAAGSTVISGFSTTRGLLPGMTVDIAPDALPPDTTVVGVEANSIVVSNAAKMDGAAEVGRFGLANDGTMFNQIITNFPRTFPRATMIEWSYPAPRNDASVYSYAIIGGYGVGSGGYFRPKDKPPPKKVSEFVDLSVTYDVSVTGNSNDFALLVETFPTTASDPLPPKVTNTMTNEIGFFPHAPNYLWSYIRTLQNHFDYSSPDGRFHAYVATKPGAAFTQFPPYTMIVPVTAAGGRTPRDMLTGPQTLPVLDLLRELVARGILPADSYVCGFDFGFEIGRNAGRATLNSIAWEWR